MGITLAILLEIVAVIAGGGNAIAIQLQQPLRDALAVLRSLQADTPVLAVWLSSRRLELAGDFHQIAVDAQLVETLDDTVHRIAGSDAVEVDLHIDLLAQLARLDTQMLHPHALTGGRKQLRR